MARPVPRRLEDAPTAVAEHVMVTADHLRLRGLVVAECTRVDPERWWRAQRPVELRGVDDPDRRAEEIGVPGVIEVEMRERDVSHVRRGEAQGLQLLRERHPHAQADAARALDAVLAFRELVAEAGVPQQRPLGVADQAAGTGDVSGFAVLFTA